MRISLDVNGERREAEIEGDESLLWVLRERLGLLATKNACEQGECGSCAVWLNGEVVNSCLVLAAQADGDEVHTVEGLRTNGRLHPVQEALLDAGAVQCGFCTPGLVVSAVDLLAREPNPERAAVREALSGHLCRCTGYKKIVDAVMLAAAPKQEELQ
jgi:carbon-monoxide dehydrogenase small subunit